MKGKHVTGKKFMSLLLTVGMVASVVPSTIFAADTVPDVEIIGEENTDVPSGEEL